MSSGKRAHGKSSSSVTTSSKKPKRQVTVTTFNKWKAQFEREHQTLSWLCCDVDDNDKTQVAVLWCQACRTHERSITGMKNLSRAWIVGSSNQKTSNIIDHATSEQHRSAMARACVEAAKAANLPITSYSPIARSLLVLDDATRERMRKKFDICYLIAKEGMPFRKYPALHALEERHGVDLGFSYKTQDSAKKFTHYIAESQRQSFLHDFSTNSFYSFLMDGSTDSGNVEDELVLVQYCTQDHSAHEIRSCARYLSLQVPTRANADGLIQCLGDALQILGIDNILDCDSVLGVQGQPVLVGGGTDGATVNIADQNGMKGKLQKELPWLHWVWCYAHRLELACKDAFSSQLFKDIAEMLLHLYYLYSKSPKRSRELADIVEDLKEVWEFSKGGDVPKRSQGSRWINHKRKALQRMVDRYGAYINHMIALSDDKSLKSTDRARLKGYIHKWKQSRMLIGAAMYVDALKAPSLLSLSLQGERLDIVGGIEYLLKSIKSLKTIAGQDPLTWPTVKLVCSRIRDDDGDKVYQGSVLANYNPTTLKACANSALADVERLEERMKSRLEWSDLELLRAILVFLDTKSWGYSPTSASVETGEETGGLEEIQAAVECIISHFRKPLEEKGVDLANIQDELEEIVTYARKYLSSSTEGYQQIWYKLHTSPVANSKWPNVLQLSQLIFSLPFSNGHVERLFSTLKVIKTDRRTQLQTATLSDLLAIRVEGPPLANFSPDEAIALWWKDCQTTRRTNQQPRKNYTPRASSTASSSETIESETINLKDWDQLLRSSDSTSELEEMDPPSSSQDSECDSQLED